MLLRVHREGYDSVSRLRELVFPVVIAIIALASLIIGVLGFVHLGHFGWIDAVVCAALLIPAGVFLLVTSYVIQHARLVAIMPLVVAAMLVSRSPAFAVAFGLALIAAIVGPLAEEWNRVRAEQKKKSATD
jgi:hypothetical protein